MDANIVYKDSNQFDTAVLLFSSRAYLIFKILQVSLSLPLSVIHRDHILLTPTIPLVSSYNNYIAKIYF